MKGTSIFDIPYSVFDIQNSLKIDGIERIARQEDWVGGTVQLDWKLLIFFGRALARAALQPIMKMSFNDSTENSSLRQNARCLKLPIQLS